MSPPSDDPEAARLRARVAELEAELAAKPPIDRLSLYRMVNAAPWGVMAINAERRLDYANPAMQPWLAAPSPAIGLDEAEAVGPALRGILADPVAEALGGREFATEASLRDMTGQARDVRLHVSPRGGGKTPVTGAIVSLYDVTETQALDRSVRENEARLNHINAVTPTANYIFDYAEGRVTWAAGMMEAVYGYTAEHMQASDRAFFRGLIHPDDLQKVIDRVVALSRRPDGSVMEIELRVRHPDGNYRWILDRGAVFERDAAGRVAKTLNAAIDIDERKRAEERRIPLINELNHRVKNTLATVQSIARQTLRAGRPHEQTIDLFTARLVALSAAHNVLTRENWQGAGLRAIVDEALEPFAARAERRIQAEGPDVRLSARAALGLAMALHELATNAAKYGGLSNDVGRVELEWRVTRAAAGPRLEMEWREQAGPPVSTPLRGGVETGCSPRACAPSWAGPPNWTSPPTASSAESPPRWTRARPSDRRRRRPPPPRPEIVARWLASAERMIRRRSAARGGWGAARGGIIQMDDAGATGSGQPMVEVQPGRRTPFAARDGADRVRILARASGRRTPRRGAGPVAPARVDDAGGRPRGRLSPCSTTPIRWSTRSTPRPSNPTSGPR
ncbi:HWE histidine kinase domain-containing protein [Phenylobacterium sp.]|uniref:sensor histidine kinase n=1 Tax=Phenylobacterium sp. TaxID=1871053 RepID=UPI0025D3B839|nr:HWE histidine kinase domain-containing protein [Phenylobacterium sp.]MBX3486172.1 PAS domain-containing protein [Phenylobacterium sp.]